MHGAYSRPHPVQRRAVSTILSDCFEDYLVPVTLPVEVFVQRFSAEGLSLLDSCVWLDGGTPAAIAIVARRGDEAETGGVRGASGLARQRHGPSADDAAHGLAAEQGVRRMWLEVIRENYAAVALYQSLGFVVHHGLCGFVSTGRRIPRRRWKRGMCSLLRRAGAEINGRLPWLMDPLTFATLPCRALL
jgi:hypothetical protein